MYGQCPNCLAKTHFQINFWKYSIEDIIAKAKVLHPDWDGNPPIPMVCFRCWQKLGLSSLTKSERSEP